MLCGSELQKNLVSNGGKSTDFDSLSELYSYKSKSVYNFDTPFWTGDQKWHPKTEHSNIGHENIQHLNISGTRLSGILIPIELSHKMFLCI